MNEGDYKWGFTNGPFFIDGLIKYTGIGYDGDGLAVLQPENDPATKIWGPEWRTPTIEEFEELFDETKCKWTWDGARKGLIIVGKKTGNYIFLPAAGYCDGLDIKAVRADGYYWSSSLNEMWTVHSLKFSYYTYALYFMLRYQGLSVRPVTEY